MYGPLNIKTSPLVQSKIKELLKEYKYAILLINNNIPRVLGVNNIDDTNYTTHWLDEDIKIYVHNKDLWDLFNCFINDITEK